MRKAVFTIVSNNYLHYARTLFDSVAVHHPECDRLCVVVDTDLEPATAYPDTFSVVSFDELALPDPRRFAFRYAILELNTAVKPWAFAALFARGYDQVVYLDPDIRLYAPMSDVFARLDDDADFVLTPHLLAPMRDDKRPSELDIRVAGAYNLGFCALAKRGDVPSFLAWWQSKLIDRCVIDFAAGLFVDQSWIDLVPGLFRNVAILRHPGYNVAYWNLAERRVEQRDDRWSVDGEPLVFFHFSGFDPHNPAAFSKHQNRFTLDSVGAARGLVLDYASAVRANDAAGLHALRYGFGFFDDAITAVPDFFRRRYRADEDLRRLLGDDPFTMPRALSMLTPSPGPGRVAITHAMRALWNDRVEIQREFTLVDDASAARYWAWFLVEARHFVSDTVVHAHRLIRESMPLGLTTPARDLLIPRGWFANEPNVVESGLWAMPEAALPFIVRGDAEVVVEGYYEAALIGRQTGSCAATLSMFVDRTPVLEVVLDQSGRFDARVRLAADAPVGLHELVFRCSSHFVPRTIGLGDDARELAWRASRIAVGDDVLLDAARQPPIAPVESLGHVDGVDLVGYLAAESGVGESVRSFARACRAVGLAYSVCDVGYQNANRQNDSSMQDSEAATSRFGINVLHVNADQTPATLAALPPLYRAARTTIAYWHWEQPELPLRFLPSFDGLTEVWVPSGFVRDAVAAISPVPVFKVPHAVEFVVPASVDRGRFGLPANRFCVLTMYDFDSSSYRKNPLAAVAAFRQACQSGREATLVIKTINADRDPDAYRELRDAVADLPDVRCIDEYLDRDEIYALEQACDCFISLHRAEGFGLGLAEMMYLGKPVIATGWSGNMEFMTPMNSFPIDYELRPNTCRTGPYELGPAWAEADIDQAAHVLGRVIDDGELRLGVGRRAAAHMRRYFGMSTIGDLYRRRLGLLSLRAA